YWRMRAALCPVIARSPCHEAIQSSLAASGLPRRFAPRNDAERSSLWICAAVLVVAVLADASLHDVFAQNPFGAPKAAPDAQVGGIVGWLLTKQSEFYREMSATIRSAKSDGSAVWTLLAISFAYGVFHAAGPGHGKA